MKMTDTLQLLYVDDDEDEHLLLSGELMDLKLPVQLTNASNCNDLFSMLESGQVFDLILLDVNMPKINGKQCLQKLKADIKYCQIPVVMFSGSHATTDIDFAFGAGAHYYLVKPYSLINLALALKKLFEIDWKANPPIPSREDFVINFAFA